MFSLPSEVEAGCAEVQHGFVHQHFHPQVLPEECEVILIQTQLIQSVCAHNTISLFSLSGYLIILKNPKADGGRHVVHVHTSYACNEHGICTLEDVFDGLRMLLEPRFQ